MRLPLRPIANGNIHIDNTLDSPAFREVVEKGKLSVGIDAASAPLVYYRRRAISKI